MLAIVLICLLSVSVAAGQAPKSSIEDQIKKYEQDWAQATVNQGAAAVDQYEADDIITTDPSGRVTDKAQDRMDLGSGDFKIQSEQLSEIKVHGYGNAAVAVGTNTLRGTYKGQDISGKYRFTDTWVNRQMAGRGIRVHQGPAVNIEPPSAHYTGNSPPFTTVAAARSKVGGARSCQRHISFWNLIYHYRCQCR